MGLNVGSVNSLNLNNQIDVQALAKVTEKILNPNNEKTVDVSKLDLSKFNRVSLGTDLYSSRTNTETALAASKAATDFDVNLSKSFSAQVQYLNSQAAQSLFSAKESNTQAAFSIDSLSQPSEESVVVSASQISETNNMDKDKKGSNPFSFYYQSENGEESEDSNLNTGSLNIFA
ncbi:MAG: hypothetical protein LUG16_06610 [Candidatus Gastranaerophilales bacterium]|nr:hypothetical protein [Candidatus Gastranaerophilales bacterium]